MGNLKFTDLRVGCVLRALEGFTCIVPGELLEVKASRGELTVRCARGDHFLDSQVDEEGCVLGFELVRGPLLDGYYSRGRYAGPRAELVGKTALVKLSSGALEAQFDDLALEELAHGWHLFPREEFDLSDVAPCTGKMT